MSTNRSGPGGDISSFTSLRWRKAYGVALANALLFLVLSAVGSVLETESLGVHVGIALLFFVGSLVSFAMLVLAGGELAALSFFVLGAGVFFGFGSAYSGLFINPLLSTFFGAGQLERLLPTVNLVNALSIVLVLASAWPLCRAGPTPSGRALDLRKTLETLKPLRLPLLMLTFSVVLLELATFPLPSNLLLRSFLSHVSAFVYLTVLLFAMQWSTLSGTLKVLVAALVIGLAGIGMLTMAKTSMLLPIVAFGTGLLFDRRARGMLIVVTAITALGYVSIFAEVCNAGRNHPIYSDQNSIADRMEIIADTWTAVSQHTANTRSHSTPLVQRFAAAQIQAYLIEKYDAGQPGQSLASAWEAVIPRIFWPEKPIITRWGPRLDSMAFRRADTASSLAPSYSSEGYWNAGWFGVAAVSCLLGLQIGWLTQKWNRFTREGIGHLGILVMAIPIALTYVWVETWFVASYVGGFVTLVVLIKLFDFTASFLLLGPLQSGRRPPPRSPKARLAHVAKRP